MDPAGITPPAPKLIPLEVHVGVTLIVIFVDLAKCWKTKEKVISVSESKDQDNIMR